MENEEKTEIIVPEVFYTDGTCIYNNHIAKICRKRFRS